MAADLKVAPFMGHPIQYYNLLYSVWNEHFYQIVQSAHVMKHDYKSTISPGIEVIVPVATTCRGSSDYLRVGHYISFPPSWRRRSKRRTETKFSWATVQHLSSWFVYVRVIAQPVVVFKKNVTRYRNYPFSAGFILIT